MTKLWFAYISLQLWLGIHPIITGPGLPPNTHIVGRSGYFLTLDAPSYCATSDGYFFGAVTDGSGATWCMDPRYLNRRGGGPLWRVRKLLNVLRENRSRPPP